MTKNYHAYIDNDEIKIMDNRGNNIQIAVVDKAKEVKVTDIKFFSFMILSLVCLGWLLSQVFWTTLNFNQGMVIALGAITFGILSNNYFEKLKNSKSELSNLVSHNNIAKLNLQSEIISLQKLLSENKNEISESHKRNKFNFKVKEMEN